MTWKPPKIDEIRTWRSPAKRRQVSTKIPHDPKTALSPREKDIVRGIARGMSNKEIATSVGITVPVIKSRISLDVFRKLKVQSRLQVALWAIQNPDQLD